VHGLLGILPKLIGLCHYSLLIGGAFFGGFHAAKSVPVGTGSLSQTAHLLSLGEMAPAQSAGICLHGKLGRDLRGNSATRQELNWPGCLLVAQSEHLRSEAQGSPALNPRQSNC
jgi:hypothetical protein